MKILQLCFRVPYPLNDGGAIAMYNMAKGFKAHDVELTMLCFNTVKHKVDSIPSELSDLGEVHTVDLDASVKPIPALLNLFTSKSYNITRFDIVAMRNKLIALITETKFDVIHFEGLFTSMYVDDARKHSPDSHLALRQHNIEHLIWQRMADGASGVKKWYLNLLAKRLKKFEDETLLKFDSIVPITAVDSEYFEKVGVKELFVSSTGIVLDAIKPKYESRPLKCFHLASMNWMPNQEGLQWLLSDVWPKVVNALPEAKLYVAGRDMPAWVYQHADEKNIDVVGEVPDAAEFMADHGLMLVPLKSGSGMRIKIVEGMSAGKAIVSTSVGAEGIEYTDGENIRIEDSEKGFAGAIIELVQSSESIEAIGHNARKLIEDKYENSHIVGELLEFYSLKIK